MGDCSIGLCVCACACVEERAWPSSLSDIIGRTSPSRSGEVRVETTNLADVDEPPLFYEGPRPLPFRRAPTRVLRMRLFLSPFIFLLYCFYLHIYRNCQINTEQKICDHIYSFLCFVIPLEIRHAMKGRAARHLQARVTMAVFVGDRVSNKLFVVITIAVNFGVCEEPWVLPTWQKRTELMNKVTTGHVPSFKIIE